MIINVLKTGSYYCHGEYNGKDIFIIRNHIQLPYTPIEKWSAQYIYLTGISKSEMDMIINNNKNQFLSIHASFNVDKKANTFIKATRVNNQKSDLWLTTISGIDYSMRRNCIITNENAISHLFSVAYNKKSPEMFEATLILQKGDVVKIGNRKSTFCPDKNPFLNIIEI